MYLLFSQNKPVIQSSKTICNKEMSDTSTLIKPVPLNVFPKLTKFSANCHLAND